MTTKGILIYSSVGILFLIGITSAVFLTMNNQQAQNDDYAMETIPTPTPVPPFHTPTEISLEYQADTENNSSYWTLLKPDKTLAALVKSNNLDFVYAQFVYPSVIFKPFPHPTHEAIKGTLDNSVIYVLKRSQESYYWIEGDLTHTNHESLDALVASIQE